MLFGKFLSAEEIKYAKEKKKARKKQIFELTQNSIIAKLREDVERLTARATHFENEWFELKKTNEILSGQLQTITGADQELKAEMYEMTKSIQQKDAEIEEMKWNNANENDDLGMQIKNLIEEVEKLRAETEIDISQLSSEEVNDQINELIQK